MHVTRKRVSTAAQIEQLHDLIERWRRHCSRLRGMLIDRDRKIFALEAELEQIRKKVPE